jgi:hypothetical protein
MIKELDVITLTHDIQEHGLKKGSQGAIVHCYQDGQAFEVEFVDKLGDSLTLLTLERADFQLEAKNSSTVGYVNVVNA